MDVKINDSQINVTVEISTWGDLLDWIETDYLKAGQCITHVYLWFEGIMLTAVYIMIAVGFFFIR